MSSTRDRLMLAAMRACKDKRISVEEMKTIQLLVRDRASPGCDERVEAFAAKFFAALANGPASSLSPPPPPPGTTTTTTTSSSTSRFVNRINLPYSILTKILEEYLDPTAEDTKNVVFSSIELVEFYVSTVPFAERLTERARRLQWEQTRLALSPSQVALLREHLATVVIPAVFPPALAGEWAESFSRHVAGDAATATLHQQRREEEIKRRRFQQVSQAARYFAMRECASFKRLAEALISQYVSATATPHALAARVHVGFTISLHQERMPHAMRTEQALALARAVLVSANGFIVFRLTFCNPAGADSPVVVQSEISRGRLSALRGASREISNVCQFGIQSPRHAEIVSVAVPSIEAPMTYTPSVIRMRISTLSHASCKLLGRALHEDEEFYRRDTPSVTGMGAHGMGLYMARGESERITCTPTGYSAPPNTYETFAVVVDVPIISFYVHVVELW